MLKKNDTPNAISKDLAKGGLIGLTGGITSKLFNVITTIVITRYIGANNYGIYSLGLSIIIVLNMFVGFGFPQGIVKYIPGFFIQNDIKKVKGVVLKSTFISTMIGFLFFILIFFSSDYLSGTIFKKESLAITLTVLSITLLFTGTTNSISSFALSIKRIDIQNLIINFYKPLIFLLLIILSVLFNLSLNGIIFSYAFAAFITTIIALYLLYKLFPQFFISSFKFDLKLKNFSAYSFSTFLTGFSLILLMRVDRMMLGYFNTASEVGIYSASANMAVYLTVLLTPLVSIFAPIASELHHKQLVSELNHAFQKTSRWLIIFTLPIFFIFVNFPKELLYLFGKDFNKGYLVLIILSCAELINVSTGPVGMLLNMTGLQKLDMYISIGALIINVALNMILIPPYGIIGASVSTALALGLVNICKLIAVKYKLRLFPYNKNLIKPIVIFASLWCIYFIFFSIYENILINIIEAIFLLLLYLVFIFLFGREKDDDFILSILRKKINKIVHSKY